MRRMSHQTSKGEVVLSRGKRSRLLWIVSIVVSLVGVAVMFAGCLMLMKQKPVEEELALMENDMGREMRQLCFDTSSEGLVRMKSMYTRSSEWLRRINMAGDLRGRDAEIDRAQRLYVLQQYLVSWSNELAQHVGERQEKAWQTLQPQIRQESKMWPVVERPETVVERGYGAGKSFVKGLNLGGLWPVWMARRGAKIMHKWRRGSGMSFWLQTRYFYYPYRRGMFDMAHLFGISVSMIGLGYLFCWIGARWNGKFFSYLGILYFFYLVVFSTLFIAIDIFAL